MAPEVLPEVVAKEPAHPVLVVDDDDALRELYVDWLEVWGLRAVTARNGLEALTHLSQTSLPSLIILDLEMPEMDGWQVLVRLKRRPELAGIPVAVVSGVDNRPRDATYFFRKPIRRDDLIEVVRAHCAVAAREPLQ